MDIAKFGAQILKEKLGLSGSVSSIIPVLVSLLGGKNNKIDIASLVSNLQSNGQLIGLVTSWLGDGKNESMSPASILSIFGDNKVGAFASALGVSKENALTGLSDVIPSMIDNASRGGKLIENLGGAGAILGKLSSFLK